MTKPAARRVSPETPALRKGLALFNARRYAEARDHFETALALNPRSSQAAVSLAHSLQHTGETDRAVEVLTVLAKGSPKDAVARAALGDLFSLQGRLSDSIAAYEAARTLAPRDASVVMSLSRLYLRAGDKQKAEEALRRAVALKAGPEASLLLGELLKEKGETSAAKTHLRRAAADRPRSEDSRALLTAGLTRFRANVKLGAFKEAFAEAEALLAAHGSQECIDSFFVSPEQAELIPTLEALKTFSVKHPESPWPHYFRAALFSNMGRGEEAITETAKLVRAPARYHWMRHKHAEILLTNLRDYAAAEREYAAAVACVPGFWKARAALAEIALCRGDDAAAARLTGEIIADIPEPSKPWGHACRGRILLWSGDYRGALASLELGVRAGVPYALRNRGASRLLLGRLEEAAADLDDALRLSVDAETLTWRGELKRLRGEHRDAVADLNAAIRLDGANSFWALADRALAKGASGDAAGLWADYTTIRRDVLDRFEAAAGAKPASPADAAAARLVLEAGLKLARGMRVSNEYLFPIWQGHGAAI